MLRRARSGPRRAWLRAPVPETQGDALEPVAPPGRRAGARLAFDNGALAALGARGLRIALPSASTLWAFRCDGREGLAVLDRHGGALVVIDGGFDPYLVRAFADRNGLGLWQGALSAAEPRYRLAGADRLRGRTGRLPLWAAVRRWAVAHGLGAGTTRT
jgi:hypothetical protein